MELQQLTDGPVGIGTRYQRRHTRIGGPIEGTMEVVEFEPGQSMGFHILDQTPNGPLEVHSRSTLEHLEGSSTRMTIYLDVPAMEASMDPMMIEGSLRRMKELIEAETQALTGITPVIEPVEPSDVGAQLGVGSLRPVFRDLFNKILVVAVAVSGGNSQGPGLAAVPPASATPGTQSTGRTPPHPGGQSRCSVPSPVQGLLRCPCPPPSVR